MSNNTAVQSKQYNFEITGKKVNYYVFHPVSGPPSVQTFRVGPADVVNITSARSSGWGWIGGFNGIKKRILSPRAQSCPRLETEVADG
jgi:acetamidase/formamidase